MKLNSFSFSILGHYRIDKTSVVPLHRAFSLFVFAKFAEDSEHKLLLQKRSKMKITWPEHWTNSVCSHPLDFELGPLEKKRLLESFSETFSEISEEEHNEKIQGVKRAAIRKLKHELGLDIEDSERISFHSKVVYDANFDSASSSIHFWGENEGIN